MAGFLGAFLGPQATVEFRLKNCEGRKTVDLPQEKGKVEKLFLFVGSEDVGGTVTITPASGKKIEHQGIKVEFIGQIELFYDRGNHYEFTSLIRELEQPGTLVGPKTYEFDFPEVEKQYESYNGINVRLR
jgi:vacuolar protein sorting-associated protein 26